MRKMFERAPRAEAALDRLKDRFCLTCSLLYQLRRRIATSAVILLALWLSMHVMFGDNGMVVYRQKRAEIKNLQKELGDLQKQNDAYAEQIKSLKSDPKAIEKEAREQLHYARPNEVVYVPPTAPNAQKPGTNSAKK